MKIKGVVAAILAAVLCFSGNLLAYTDGDGSAENPYQIANKADLLELAADTGNYDKCFILTADIDLATESFTGAVIAPDIDAVTDGYQGTEFAGVFDGNGHTTSNLTITATDMDCVGLFGYFSSGGHIKNLGVVQILGGFIKDR